MDETTFKTLNALSVWFDRPTSINGLVGQIREMHESAYYKNIYEKVLELEKTGVIRLERIGRNSEISLDFGNYAARDMLMEMELRKKQEALERSKNLQNILPEIEEAIRHLGMISSTSMISPVKTLPLNRIELLVMFRESPGTEGLVQKEMLRIYEEIRELQDKRNLKIDTLALRESEFSGLLKADEWNPLPEMISGQIAFLYPQNFWALMEKSIKERTGFRKPEEINMARIPEHVLVYNMDRFGYREIGMEAKWRNKEIEGGRKLEGTRKKEGVADTFKPNPPSGSHFAFSQRICLECIITSMLLSGKARRIEAVPIVLAKNTPNYSLLIFLSRKYGTEGRFLGLLKVLDKIKGSKESEYAIKALETLKAREEKADERSIMEKMRLYHGD